MSEPLRPYQLTDAAWLFSKDRAFLALEQGLGKTVIAIRAANDIGARRILVVCPAIAKINWQREIVRWSRTPLGVTIISKLHTKPVIPDQGWVIVNYDVLSRRDTDAVKGLLDAEWDLLILDEAHALKSRVASRTKCVYGPRCDGVHGLVSHARRVWLLSGTPMPNNASELWPHMRALTPDLLRIRSPNGTSQILNYQDFLDYFCTTAFRFNTTIVTGSKNLDSLRERMRPFMKRRTKLEVLPELPRKQIAPFWIDSGDISRTEMAAIHREEKQVKPEQLEDITSGGAAMHLSTLRRLTGMVKVPIVVKHVVEEFGLTRKVVVFAHHRDVIATLFKAFQDAGLRVVVVEGGMTTGQKQKAIDAFQTDPATTVFLGQIQAAGEAITLTAASDVLVVEPSWVPKENAQAIDRVHRIGQNNAVLVKFFTLLGSLDEKISQVLMRKTRAISQLVDQMEDKV